MTAFDCKGWLYITLYELSAIASVTISHSEDHVHYWSISVPKEIKDFVNKNTSLTVDQVQYCIYFAYIYIAKYITLAMAGDSQD